MIRRPQELLPIARHIAAARNRGMQQPGSSPRYEREYAYHPRGESRRNGYFVAQLLGQAVHHLIGFLSDGFLHLHLQYEVRAALQVQTEVDLLGEIVLKLRERRWKCRQSEQSIDAEKDHRQDEQRFPLQIRVHD